MTPPPGENGFESAPPTATNLLFAAAMLKSEFVEGNGLVRRVQVSRPSAAHSDRDQRIRHTPGNIRILFFEFLIIRWFVRAI